MFNFLHHKAGHHGDLIKSYVNDKTALFQHIVEIDFQKLLPCLKLFQELLMKFPFISLKIFIISIVNGFFRKGIECEGEEKKMRKMRQRINFYPRHFLLLARGF